MSALVMSFQTQGRRCGICRQTGHDRRNCPHSDVNIAREQARRNAIQREQERRRAQHEAYRIEQARRQAEVERQRAEEQRLRELRGPVNHSTHQLQAWIRRLTNEIELERNYAQNQPKKEKLKIKMVSDYHDFYDNDGTQTFQCCVCLDQHDHSNGVGLTCKHLTCIDCTKELCSRNKKCPQCRADFKEILIPKCITVDNFNKVAELL